MKRRFLAFALPLALALAGLSGSATGEDLVQIYADALTSDPTLAAARANWAATQQAVPQARAGLLPAVSLLGTGNEQDFNENLRTDPQTRFHQRFGQRRLHGFGKPTALPGAELDFARSGEAAGQPERLRPRLGAAGPDRARRRRRISTCCWRSSRSSSPKASKRRSARTSRRRSATSRSAPRPSPTPTMRRPSMTRSRRSRSSVRNDLENKLAALRAIIGRDAQESEPRRT